MTDTWKQRVKRVGIVFVFLVISTIIFSIPGMMITKTYNGSIDWFVWISWGSGFAIGLVCSWLLFWSFFQKQLQWKIRYEELETVYHTLETAYNALERNANRHRQRGDRLRAILSEHFEDKEAMVRKYVESYFEDSPIDKYEVKFNEQNGRLEIQIGTEGAMVEVDTTPPVRNLAERLDQARVEWLG